jgi:ArsR family transcriptional regulator
MQTQTTLFWALSDSLRLRCLALIARGGELCVCQLSHSLQAPQPKVSKHLAVLREAGLIVQRRVAQWVLYRLVEHSGWYAEVLVATLAGLDGEPLVIADRARLVSAPEGPPAALCCAARAEPTTR